MVVLVHALVRVGRGEEALEVLREAPTADRTDEGLAMIGQLFIVAGDPATGLELCRGDSAPAWRVRAEAYLALGQHAEGLAAYKRAVAADPAVADAELHKALSRLPLH
jgi:pentatricopeptide repeat protein